MVLPGQCRVVGILYSPQVPCSFSDLYVVCDNHDNDRATFVQLVKYGMRCPQSDIQNAYRSMIKYSRTFWRRMYMYPLSIYKKRATIGPSAKRHLMAFRWRADSGPKLFIMGKYYFAALFPKQ